MKTSVIMLFSLITSQVTNAARTCEDYITDEWPNSRYTIEIISADNVVTDNKTNLMWKQCSEGLSGVDCNTGVVTTHSWQQSINIPTSLNIIGFAGYTDWRLPNIEELRSLAAINCFNPAINETVFPNTPPNKFWTSSPIANYLDSARFIIFDYSFDEIDIRASSGRVRLVRSIQ